MFACLHFTYSNPGRVVWCLAEAAVSRAMPPLQSKAVGLFPDQLKSGMARAILHPSGTPLLPLLSTQDADRKTCPRSDFTRPARAYEAQ